MSHLKRIRVPKSIPIKIRKERKYIARPLPGPHQIFKSITLNTLFKDVINHATTSKEVKNILNDGKILVDGLVRKDNRFPIGLMDIISLPSFDEYYVMLYINGKLTAVPINKTDSDSKPHKIVGKKVLKKGKLQLNLYDGKNVLVDKDNYKVGDSVILFNKTIKKHLKLEKGALVYLTEGKHQGTVGTLQELQHFHGLAKDRVILNANSKKIVTRKDYAFVIDKEFK
ncbi:30S ribosomal protein S4e [Candidatus Woesearchaeota archaeon]|nr:30S ribosomal protein S4e [Candidatus Woesearchaeota archaeon]